MQRKRDALIANRYQILSVLGQGGMGIVYRALDRLRGQHVALKSISTLAASSDANRTAELTVRAEPSRTLPMGPGPASITLEDVTGQAAPEGRSSAVAIQLVQDPMALRIALAQEFRTLASLRHPNIITVLDYGFDAKHTPFFTMEILSDARPLMSAGQRMPYMQRIELLLQVAQALVYLHRRGVLHRDLKPANILALPTPLGYHIKVLDFGLAIAKSTEVATQNIVGTLTYMAPELLSGKPPTEATDFYSFGVTAYELLAGRSPFAEPQTGDVVSAILNTIPETQSLPIPPALRDLLDRLLAKDPAARPRDASSLCYELAVAAGHSMPPETNIIRDSFLQAAAFVARDDEVAALVDAIDDAELGRGSGWLVGGESGVGKSRLIEEVSTLARVRGIQVLRGETVRAGGAPYQAFRDILRGLCLQVECSDAQASLLLPLIPDLPVLLMRDVPEPPAVDAKSAQERLLRAIDDCFGLVRTPTVVVVEDIHWAGVEVILACSRLMRSIRKRPVVLIASFRDDEAPWVPSALPAMDLIKLSRLDRASVTALSESMLGPLGRHPDLIQLLLRETEGNAFFMIEVLRSLAEERGMLSEIASNRLPDRVFAGGMRAVLERRLSRVPADARPLLHLAAVAGRQLDLNVLRTLQPQLDGWLEACANVAVIEAANEGWRFTHDKLREQLIEELSPERRRLLHRQVAELIEQTYTSVELDPARLAYHYSEAGVADLAVRYIITAGERALREGAIERSLTHLNELHRWQDQINPATPLAAGFRLAGGSLLVLGRVTESVARFELAWSALGFPLPRTEEMSGAAARAIQIEVTQAVEAVITGASLSSTAELEAIELAAQSLPAFLWLGRHASAYRIGVTALYLVKRLGLVPFEFFFHRYIHYILSLYSLDDDPDLLPSGMAPDADESGTFQELRERLDGMLALLRGQWEEVVRCFREAIRTSDQNDYALLSSLCHLQITLALCYEGRFDRAIAESDVLLQHAANHASNHYQAWGHSLKAVALIKKGLLKAAGSELSLAKRNLDRIADPLCSLTFLAAQALVSLSQGHIPEARALADVALAQLDEYVILAHEAIEPTALLMEVYCELAELADEEPSVDAEATVESATAQPGGAERAEAHLVRLASFFEIGRSRLFLIQGARRILSGNHRRGHALVRLSLRYARRYRERFEEARAHYVLSRIAAANSLVRQRHERAGREILTALGFTWPPLLAGIRLPGR